jgi:antitoxin FitA
MQGFPMAAVTIRKLSDEAHRALKARAKKHARSAEAEMRTILEESVRPKQRLKIGSELAAFGRKYGGLELDITRDQTPTDAPDFS